MKQCLCRAGPLRRKKRGCYIVDSGEFEGYLPLYSFVYYVDEDGHDCFWDKKRRIKLVFYGSDSLGYWVDYKRAMVDDKKADMLKGEPLGWVEIDQFNKRQ